MISDKGYDSKYFFINQLLRLSSERTDPFDGAVCTYILSDKGLN